MGSAASGLERARGKGKERKGGSPKETRDREQSLAGLGSGQSWSMCLGWGSWADRGSGPPQASKIRSSFLVGQRLLRHLFPRLNWRQSWASRPGLQLQSQALRLPRIVLSDAVSPAAAFLLNTSPPQAVPHRLRLSYFPGHISQSPFSPGV